MNNKVICLGKSYANEDNAPVRLSEYRQSTEEVVSALRHNSIPSFPKSLSHSLVKTPSPAFCCCCVFTFYTNIEAPPTQVPDGTDSWQKGSLGCQVNEYSFHKHLLNLIYVVSSLIKTEMDVF